MGPGKYLAPEYYAKRALRRRGRRRALHPFWGWLWVTVVLSGLAGAAAPWFGFAVLGLMVGVGALLALASILAHRPRPQPARTARPAGVDRCSDADREHAARRLNHAAGEGRLTADELAARLDDCYNARTYEDLEAVTGDLPDQGSRPTYRP